MGIPWSHITPEEMERNRMYNYRDLSKEEYEDVYNEKIIYCKIHHISGIDGCIACEQEEDEEGLNDY